MKTPYEAVIKNSAGVEIPVVVREHDDEWFEAAIKGADVIHSFQNSDWTITPTVKVPTGLGAVVEHPTGFEIIRFKSLWRSEAGNIWPEFEIRAILLSGGRVLSWGVDKNGNVKGGEG